jgi:glycosyltransferase involved in cell wall biosynthesis
MNVVVIVTPGFPENEQDTTCLPAFQQFALSAKKCFPQLGLVILTFQYPFTKKEYEWHGIKVISLGGKNNSGFFRVLIWIRAYLTLRKIKRQNTVVGLLSLWLTECSLVANYFGKFNGLKHYMWLIGQDAKLTNAYIARIKPKGDNIIAMSDFLQEEFFKNHKQNPFLVAENGINESAFPPLNTGNRQIDIIGVGSLSPLKNYKQFIEVVCDVQKKYPHVKAAIIGAGEEEDSLKELVKQLQLQNTIAFLGLLPHTKVFEWMNDSKLFLHTSYFEGNSTVLMEALYSGCKVVSKQSLRATPVKNLHIKTTKEEMINCSLQILQENAPPERVVFNTMDKSAEKIISLFL